MPRGKTRGSRESTSSSTRPPRGGGSPDSGALASLIRPTTTKKFLREIWDKAPALFHQPAGFGHLFTLADLETLVRLGGPRHDASILRVTRTVGEASEERSITGPGGSLSLQALYGAWADGFTIIANGLQRRWPAVAEFCQRLEFELRCPIGANLYSTPAGAQGFAAHFDTHDVFVLQIEGKKTWRVFPPGYELPLENKETKVDPRLLGRPMQIATLTAGDVLYIPRGFIHDAVTAGAHSVHLTVGMHQARWVDLVKDLVTAAAARDVRFRRALPLEDTGGTVRGTVSRLLSSLNAGDLIEQSLERTRQRPIRSGQPLPDGHFVTLNRLTALTASDVLAHRSGMSCVVTRDDTASTIRFPGSIVSGPAWMEPVLKFVAAHQVFAIREMPDVLTSKAKCLLAARLIREGLLRFHHSQGAAIWQRRRARRGRASRKRS